MKTHQVILSPEDARRLVDSHSNVRNPKKAAIARYALDMQLGRWVESCPQGLLFDVDGKLVDGQHRLLAQIAAGVTLTWTVTTGVGPDVVSVIDQGSPRGIDAVLFGTDLSGKARIETVNLLIMLKHSARVKLSAGAMKNAIAKLPEKGLKLFADHTGSPRITAPVRGAFLLCWLRYPSAVETIWAAFVARDVHLLNDPTIGQVESFTSLVNVGSSKVSTVASRIDLAGRMCNVLNALVEGRCLTQVKNNPTVFKRMLDGLPVLIGSEAQAAE